MPLALVLVLLLIVGGAGIAATAAYFELKPAPVPPGSISLTDDEGRTVAAPSNPHRVVVLAPSILDTMVRLGLRDRVVGVDCGPTGLGTDYNGSQIANWSLTSSICVGTYPSLNIPQLLNASPQLVLASTIVSLSDVEELSSTYHLPVLVLQPATLGGITVDVNLLAEIFPVSSAADALVGQLQKVLGNAQVIQANLTNSGASLPTVLVTYYAVPASSPDPGYWSYGPGTFGESLIEFVGASSISASSQLPYPVLSGPQVLLANPSVIIYGTGFGVDLSEYQQGPDWSSLGAVTGGHAWGVDGNLLTEPDPTMILDGIPILFGLIHPGLYPPA
ncbi:MAG: ABC transporter substrate-binding protein [Thermoplasmata archaeon]|nr:ABC transporter substrate-binding protein [Thermoplasmata archaeon]MCI4337752.1 ABC transporter substrate-binding protein [Thermoplasmata archaeon]MCI4341309.1 ABC transporter substrate-binding protein [Thermoplasmata archaeon]